METKIVPFEEGSYEDGEIIVDTVSVTYAQKSDSSGEDGEEEAQEMTLTARNNGVARFINIKTKSWSIDDISEIEKIIEDFKKRAGL